jgi:hypothetical protein
MSERKVVLSDKGLGAWSKLAFKGGTDKEVTPALKALKKKQKFTAKHDSNPGLSPGQQSKLPDAVQAGILKKAGQSRRTAILIKAALLSKASK